MALAKLHNRQILVSRKVAVLFLTTAFAFLTLSVGDAATNDKTRWNRTCHPVGRAHDAAVPFPAGAIVVAHLNSALKSSPCARPGGPVQRSLKIRDRIIRIVAEQGSVVHFWGIHDLARIKCSIRIEKCFGWTKGEKILGKSELPISQFDQDQERISMVLSIWQTQNMAMEFYYPGWLTDWHCEFIDRVPLLTSPQTLLFIKSLSGCNFLTTIKLSNMHVK